MKPENLTRTALIATASACFFLGFLVNDWKDSWCKQSRPSDMVEVEILELCKNSAGEAWTLLQTDDGQRCFTYNYRGVPGDVFNMFPGDIEGYRVPNAAEIELTTVPKPQIDLSGTNPKPEDSES